MEISPSQRLGIEPDASLEEIHTAYRHKAGQHHPDLGGDRTEFVAIAAAYETMLANHQRAQIAASEKRAAADADVDLNTDAENIRRNRQNSANANRARPNRARPSAPQRKSKQPVAAGKRNPRRAHVAQSDAAAASAWKHVMTGKLPLQDHTTYFILFNVLDIFLTYLILTRQGVEANPIANFFFRIGNIQGMIAFKMAIVAAVCILAQVIATRSIQTAGRLLTFGTIAVGCVVLYSVWLLARVQ